MEAEEQFKRNSSDGGKIGAGSRVKLACRRIFVPIFTSDGYPMLLYRSFPVKKMSHLNRYIYSLLNHNTTGRK